MSTLRALSMDHLHTAPLAAHSTGFPLQFTGCLTGHWLGPLPGFSNGGRQQLMGRRARGQPGQPSVLTSVPKQPPADVAEKIEMERIKARFAELEKNRVARVAAAAALEAQERAKAAAAMAEDRAAAERQRSFDTAPKQALVKSPLAGSLSGPSSRRRPLAQWQRRPLSPLPSRICVETIHGVDPVQTLSSVVVLYTFLANPGTQWQ